MTSPKTSRAYGGRTAEERRAQRRERLTEAGLELFGTDGYPATSIEKICATAGVSTRNFYEEFAGREALLIALHNLITERTLTAVAAALADADQATLRERIELAVHAYITTITSDVRWARLAYVEVIGVSTAVERNRLELRRQWIELLEAETRRGASRGEAADRDYRLTSIAFIGAVNELVRHWSMESGAVPVEQLTAELTRQAMAITSISP